MGLSRASGAFGGDHGRGWRLLWLAAVALAAAFAAAPATAGAAPFAYVANGGISGMSGTASVSQYDVGPAGLLAQLSPATLATGGGAHQVAISPDDHSVYVTEFNAVLQYDVGAGGTLQPKSPATVASGFASGVTVSPDGHSVYVVNGFPKTVSQYDVGVGGTLQPKSPATVATGNSPYEIAVSPDGHSAYVTNGGANTVSQYDVGVGGTLQPKSPATVATGPVPEGVAVSRSGASVYVTNDGGNTLSQYDVGTGGTLQPKSPATVAAGRGPIAVAVSPDAGSVYVANCCSSPGTVSQYDVGTGGALQPKSPATVAAGGVPVGLAVSPNGTSVYVTNETDNTVSQYNVGIGGALQPMSPATVAAGNMPFGIAVSGQAGPPPTTGGGATSQPPQITGIGPNAGPNTGGTRVTITGHNFSAAARPRVIFGSGGATNVVVTSPTTLDVTTPSVDIPSAGNVEVDLFDDNGSATWNFIYFVPQVGKLVYRDPTWPPGSPKHFSECTASVVQSVNHDTISTAGHCVLSPKSQPGDAHTVATPTWNDQIAFAPGFYGAYKQPCLDQAVTPSQKLRCGETPYGVWQGRGPVTTPRWYDAGDSTYDIGFVPMRLGGDSPIGHIQDSVGSLGIVFCQGRSFPGHVGCDPGSGATLRWDVVSEQNATFGPIFCRGKEDAWKTPPLLKVSPCGLGDGSSGGPWLGNPYGRVGAVSQGTLPGVPRTLFGAYLGSDAETAFNVTQYSGAISAIWEALASGAGSLERERTAGVLARRGFSLRFKPPETGSLTARLVTSPTPSARLARRAGTRTPLASGHRPFKRGRNGALIVRLTKSGLRTLRKARARRRAVRVTLTLRFRRSHGSALKASQSLTLR